MFLGFPIQVNIPVLPTVSAKVSKFCFCDCNFYLFGSQVTFTDFNWAEGEVSYNMCKRI